MHDNLYDMIIIGGGVSGLGAAIYAGRFQMKTLVLTKEQGGTIILTNEIANYPGFSNISGMELADNIQKHAEDYDVEFQTKAVTKIKKCDEGCYMVFTGENEHFHTKTIVFATGTEWRKLQIPGEEEYFGKGVHYCALCDGPFYKDKVVAIVGGADSAAKEALLLSEYAKKVYVIHRGDTIRAEPINTTKILNNDKIELISNMNVTEIHGDKFVNKIVLDKDFNGSKDFKLNGLFIAIGHIPLTDLAKDIGVELNQKNEIIIDRNSQTNLKGVYAAGDVTDTSFKQAITGVGEGVTAAYNAYHYINKEEIICACNDELYE